MTDKWQHRCETAIQRGRQIIAKCNMGSRQLYVLWDGEDRQGHYSTADEAKAKADEIIAASLDSDGARRKAA